MTGAQRAKLPRSGGAAGRSQVSDANEGDVRGHSSDPLAGPPSPATPVTGPISSQPCALLSQADLSSLPPRGVGAGRYAPRTSFMVPSPSRHAQRGRDHIFFDHQGIPYASHGSSFKEILFLHPNKKLTLLPSSPTVEESCHLVDCRFPLSASTEA